MSRAHTNDLTRCYGCTEHLADCRDCRPDGPAEDEEEGDDE